MKVLVNIHILYWQNIDMLFCDDIVVILPFILIFIYTMLEQVEHYQNQEKLLQIKTQKLQEDVEQYQVILW